MHVVFKDSRSRLLDGLPGLSSVEPDGWLPVAREVATCEVYEDHKAVRGRLIAVYTRDEVSGRWRREAR